MSDVSLSELLDLSIGTPRPGAVNFTALHALLRAVLRRLGIREVKIRWSGDELPDAPMGVTGPGQDPDQDPERLQIEGDSPREVQPGSEPQRRVASSPGPPPSSSPAADGLSKLRSRIQTCEDGVSQAMTLIQTLHTQRDSLKVQINELHQHKMEGGTEPDMAAAVETCCRRVETLEETVRSLKDTVQKYPDDLSRCVTWDVMESALLSGGGDQQRLDESGVVDLLRSTDEPYNSNTSPIHPAEDSAGPPVSSEEVSAHQLTTETSLVLSGPPGKTHAGPGPVVSHLSRTGGGSERYLETVDALRTLSKLKEKFNHLETRVAALEEGKVDQTQLDQLRDTISNQGSQDVTGNLMDQLKEQRKLIDSLVEEREKLDSLDDVSVSQDRETSSEAAPGSEDSDIQELRQQMSVFRKCLQKLEESLKLLKIRQAASEQRHRDQNLQDQLDNLQGRLEDMMLSLTSELQDGGRGLSQGKGGLAVSTSSVNMEGQLSRLFQHYEHLQERVNCLLRQQTGSRAGMLQEREDRQSVDLMNDVQTAILQLQAECEKLHETTSQLHEDNRQKHSHIQELFKTTEELEEKKADKLMVENEIKADKSALDSKVSRLQFDSATEQLNTMFHQLQGQVTDQAQDWHKVMDKLSSEMECKLVRTELDTVKKQLEDCRKNIDEKLQTQGAAEHEDAAALRKQLVDRFHCLSCDRPVVKQTPGPHLMTLPSSPGFSSHRSIRPFTVYALEQFRQHYRSLKSGTNCHNFVVANSGRRREQIQMCRQMEKQLKRSDRTSTQDTMSENQNQLGVQLGVQHERVAELSDYSHLAVSRSCGGSHTVTSASQRRSGLQNTKHHSQPDGEGVVQSEEVDIVGLDGHIYRGRLNVPAVRTTETKLPAITTKDVTSGVCRTKDKAKCSLSHKPAASPEGGHAALGHHPLSMKSAQCSRSVSSCSGRDWPVSAMGCPSQSSQASAASVRPVGGDTELSDL